MKHTIDMTQGNPIRILMRFSIPVILGSLLQQLYGTVDSIVVGQINGVAALAAVGLSGTVVNLLLGFVLGVTNGAAVVVSQYQGARNGLMVQRSVLVNLLSAFLLALCVSVLGVLLAPTLLHWLRTPPDVMDDAAAYLRICLGGSVFMILYNACAAMLRGIGDARAPLYVLAITCVANILLDLLFVGAWGMGVAGAAWATVLAQLVSAVFSLWMLLKRVPLSLPLRDAWKECGLLLRRTLSIGLPTGIQQTLASMGGVVVQGLINSFGTVFIAANNIVIKVDHFCVMPLQGFSIAVNTFVGQNIGAGHYERAKRGTRDALWMGCGLSVLCSALMLLLGRYPMRLFTDDAQTIEVAARILACIAPFWIGLSLQLNIAGALRGAGQALVPMVVTLGSMMAFRIPVAYLLTGITGNPYMAWLAMGINWLLTGGGLLLYYRSGRWMRAYSRKE